MKEARIVNRLKIAFRTALMLIAIGCVSSSAQAANLLQTFEDGEDTSNWGSVGNPSVWANGAVGPTFLTEALGGENAGTGSSNTQGFSREFRYNSAGIDVSEVYTMSMYFQINSFDAPSGGEFYILDGYFGAENTANVRLVADGEGGYVWQAKNGGPSSWDDFENITFGLGQPYRVELTIDPTSLTYSVTLQGVDSGGGVQTTETFLDLAFDGTVITNGNNGNLTFHIQASAGSAEVMVDNINITGIPEPTTVCLLLVGIAGLICSRRRAHC